ncbi:MAG: zinc ribbon domain-containing protein [Smithellaceae bacterium]|nr:zinc ribbon domain-containing protein [Smithellaceae bacterium]
MKIISVIFLIVFILSTALLVLTFRKPRKVSVFSLMLAMIISLVTLTIFSLLINYRPSLLLIAAMAIAGLLIGVVWSQATRIYIENGKVMSHNSVWYLVVWGGIFVLSQIIAITTNRIPAVIMALLMMSTASVIGMNGRIIGKYFEAKSSITGAQAPSGQCPRCGALIASGTRFCGKCGEKL